MTDMETEAQGSDKAASKVATLEMLESGLDSEQSDARAQTLCGLATHKPRASRSQGTPGETG